MFYKISSSGNNFIVIYNPENFDIKTYSGVLEDVDGLIVLYPSSSSTANFIIFNKDGSRAKMCGNGLICATTYFKKILKSERSEFQFLTDSGFYKTEALDDGSYTVHFPKPKILLANPTTGIVDSGNMHMIQIVEHIDPNLMIDQQKVIGGTFNIHHIQKSIDEVYLMLSLENGVGFTKSCGTGCISSFAYLRSLSLCEKNMLFKTLGGVIKVSENDNEYLLNGHSEIIYFGELYDEKN